MNRRDISLFETQWKPFYAGVCALADSMAVVASLAVGYAINFNPSFQGFLSHQWKLVAYSVVLFGGLNATFGVYRQAYTSPVRLQVAAAFRAYILGTLIIFATLFLFRNTYYSSGALLTYVLVLPVSFLVERLVLDRIRLKLHKSKVGVDPVVVVLVDDSTTQDGLSIVGNSPIGFDIVAVVDVSKIDVLEAGNSIREKVEKHHPLCIIVFAVTLDSHRLSVILSELLSIGVLIRLSSHEVHDALTRTRLYDFAGIALLPKHMVPAKTIHRFVKRLFDILVSGTLLIASTPLLFVIALAIRLESAGGVLFRQVRSLAPKAKLIRVFKFRSMKVNSFEAEGGQSPDVQNAPSKSPLDPRITRVGRFIRKYSLDEFPQLLNVFVGDMSLVGPRPLPVTDFKKLPSYGPVSFLYGQRALVKPGLTGLWQISGRSGLNYQQMVILDLYYAEHESFLFDLEILLETIPAVISGRGAY